MSFLTILTSPFTAFLSSDPQVAMTQAGLLALVVVVLFLLFYTLRDIVLRTRSFVFQCCCILLVAALPGVGFLLYLLIRPERTLKQRELEAMVEALTVAFFGSDEDVETQTSEEGAGEDKHAEPKKEHHHGHDSHHHS